MVDLNMVSNVNHTPQKATISHCEEVEKGNKLRGLKVYIGGMFSHKYVNGKWELDLP